MLGNVQIMKLGFVFAAALVALCVSSGASQAATCSNLATDKVKQNPGPVAASCFEGTAGADSLTGATLQVNADQAFGFSDWLFAGKNTGAGATLKSTDIGFSTSGSNQLYYGTFAFDADAFTRWTDIMIVMATTTYEADQQNYVAYRLSPTLATTGSYFTAFYNPTNVAKPGKIDYLSIYVREAVTQVPTPAALPLFAAALAGLGFVARRRKKA